MKLSPGYYTFGHELAHNFGSHHDPDTSSNNIYTYGHGYLIPGYICVILLTMFTWSSSGGYRTILAYTAPGHETRVNHYSNPRVVYPGSNTSTGHTGGH